jgi:hypothetical protein
MTALRGHDRVALYAAGAWPEREPAGVLGPFPFREDPMQKLMRAFGSMMVVAFLVTAALGDEEKVSPDKVPQKVQDAVKAKFPEAKVIKASKEKENNETIYEVAIKNGDQKITMDIKEDGTIVEYEKEINVKDLPKAVSEALAAKYPNATFKTAEEVYKNDKLDSYEVIIEPSGKKAFEVVVSPEGKILKDGGEKKGDK